MVRKYESRVQHRISSLESTVCRYPTSVLVSGAVRFVSFHFVSVSGIAVLIKHDTIHEAAVSTIQARSEVQVGKRFIPRLEDLESAQVLEEGSSRSACRPPATGS